MSRKLKIGIIGTGGIAGSHVNSYKNFEDVEIVCGCDIIPGKARAFFDNRGLPEAKAFDSKEDMFKAFPDLDGVSVCTYNQTHAECAVAAMEAGYHVLLEKPMCVTMAQATEILKAEKKTGKIITIGFQPRYDPNMIKVKEIVQSGDLGKIYYVQTGGGRRRGMPGGTFIRKDTAGVGALADIGCYGLDMPLNSLGYPKPLTVSAVAKNYFGTSKKYNPGNYMNFEVDDFSAALIRLEGDITLDFRMSWAMHMDTTGSTIFLGTEKGLKVQPAGGGAWDGTVGPMTIFHDSYGMQTETPIPVQQARESCFGLKCRAFCDAIINNGPAPIPTSQIIYNQAIIDGIIRSSASGREVDIVIPEV